jgi:hypothetical protein
VISEKIYSCSRCGFKTKQTTNHYGPTWSCGRVNICPKCPPWAKYPEFNGRTIWNCLDSSHEDLGKGDFGNIDS